MIIHILNYPVEMKIGCYPEEKLAEQTVLVSLAAQIACPVNDQLRQTVDYVKLLRAVDELLAGREVNLIESAVKIVGVQILQGFAAIQSLKVTLEKTVIPEGCAKGAQIKVSETFFAP